ncbi:Hypothetical protein NTJ_00914 [Nesidiocoris tenuis]|uniref:Protein OSCP1 n=1 Tax=Nesidiocoris tenuis TaxID=355587 RepID=A0ABN7A767_9HEMI|nr:Hypothetical protein NTJ_00914 [Nesidiocoris tenuis]
MTYYTLPFLFLNLGGEMMYILDQRLRAQNIAVEKARKVLNDIVRIMYNPRFMEELFKPQEIYNKAALKSLFQDLAHASIMKLNATSMDKLYDLMTMVFKWQVFTVSHPRELILVTLNHMDSTRAMVTDQTIHKQLDSAYFMFIKTYGQMSCGELQRVRYSLLNFMQDVRIRVSLLLRQRLQNADGSFTIPTQFQLFYGSEPPGKIRTYSRDGIPVDISSFYPGGRYTVSTQPCSTELRGVRNTTLGSNIYSGPRLEEEPQDLNYGGQESFRKEINLLVAQLGQQNVPVPPDSFSLELFNLNDSTVPQITTTTEPATDSLIEPSQTTTETNPHAETLSKILAEMQPTIPKDQSEFDLLNLMEELN